MNHAQLYNVLYLKHRSKQLAEIQTWHMSSWFPVIRDYQQLKIVALKLFSRFCDIVYTIEIDKYMH